MPEASSTNRGPRMLRRSSVAVPTIVNGTDDSGRSISVPKSTSSGMPATSVR